MIKKSSVGGAAKKSMKKQAKTSSVCVAANMSRKKADG
jgi:hypothetical protein